MLCSNCKSREADVLIKQVVGSEVSDIHLCRVCAEEMGFISSEEMPSITISFSFKDADAFRHLRTINQRERQEAERVAGLRCPSCGTSFEDFRKESVLGCPKCYETFRAPLGDYMQRVHGAESHICTSASFDELDVRVERRRKNRMPILLDDSFADAMGLEHEIAEAVAKEEYERASQLKEKLKALGFGGDTVKDD